MFICGSGNFAADPDSDAVPASKRSKRTTTFCRGNTNNKNPYADRGLDKFYALLADLDDKKQKIYTRMGSEDISFVRFVYTSDQSNHVKPIVVKVKEKTNRKRANHEEIAAIASATRPKEETVKFREQKKGEEGEKTSNNNNKKKRYLKTCCKGKWLDGLRQKQPYWYFVGIVVLIMLLLAIFGRSFAIVCTSIGWYLVPSVVGGSGDSDWMVERKPKRKKESGGKSSEDPSSPTSVLPNNNKSNNRKVQKLQHRHGKKLYKLSTL